MLYEVLSEKVLSIQFTIANKIVIYPL